MVLELYYIINQGIEVSEEIVSEDGERYKESVEVIVRNIDLFPEGVKVDFDLLGLNECSKLSLCEDERYDVTPLCTLHLPRNPLGLSRYELRKILPRYPLIRKSLPRRSRVILKFYAPKAVEFSEKKMYD